MKLCLLCFFNDFMLTQIRKLVLKLLEHIRSSPEKSERQSLLSSPSLTREGSLKRLSSLNASPSKSAVPTDAMPPNKQIGSEVETVPDAAVAAPTPAVDAAHYSLSYSEEKLHSSLDDGISKEAELAAQPLSAIPADSHKYRQEDTFDLDNALEDLDKEFGETGTCVFSVSCP
jgi:hypothetical protein